MTGRLATPVALCQVLDLVDEPLGAMHEVLSLAIVDRLIFERGTGDRGMPTLRHKRPSCCEPMTFQ
jgi:hypothetical protein